VMLKSHSPSPLAQQLVGHIRDLVAESSPVRQVAQPMAAGD